MELCSRCHKRVAVVYISRIENGKTINEGICLKCAKELGIKPVDDIISKMGLSEDDIDRMDMEMEGMIGQNDEDGENPSETGLDTTGENSDGTPDSRSPAIDFQKLMGQAMSAFPKAFQNQNQNQNQQNPSGGPSQKQDKNAPKDAQKPKRKFLDLYCQSLTDKAKDGKLDHIVGRDRELGRVIQILCRRQKNNPCLIGEPGVGKTAIAEALAERIAAGNVPYKLRDKEVQLVDLTSLVAGTQFRGQFETRMKGLIDEVKALGNIILVIDEVHSIVGAGDAEGSMNAANILKPALSRGEIQVIGATTLAEYRKYIEKDSALERRFQPIVVEEPSIEDSVEILRGIKGYYEAFHNIHIPDDTVRRAVILSERYITDRFLPDKAIDLLDEASSYLSLNTPAIGKRAELTDSITRLETEQSELEASESTDEKKYARLADIKVALLKAKDELTAIQPDIDAASLSNADLAKVIEIWTGVPASSITEHEFARLEKLDERLKSHIVGQDAAVDSVVRAIKRSRAGVSYKRKPVSFIFAGPTGVGKTELVKQLALDLFNSPETLIRLDMSEFMEKHSVSRIIGAPPGYVGYDEAGQLTEKIRRKPYSVVLFDEIEKAHPDVMNILLQILDDGHITDAQGRTVNFENTVIIMTTNAGSTFSSGAAGFGATTDKLEENRTMKALSEFLRPEFLNRVDEIVTFRALDENDFRGIAHIMLGELKKTLAEKDIAFSWTEEASTFIAHASFDRKYGARNMRRYIQTNVEDKAANLIIESYETPVKALSLEVVNGALTVSAQKSSETGLQNA